MNKRLQRLHLFWTGTAGENFHPQKIRTFGFRCHEKLWRTQLFYITYPIAADLWETPFIMQVFFYYYLFVCFGCWKSGLKHSSKSENDQSSQEFSPCAPAPSKSSRCCATTEIWEHFFANSIHRVVKLSHKTSDDSGSFEPFDCCVLHSHASPTKSHFSMRPLSLVYFKLMLAFPRLLSAPRIFPH